jgi:putative transposase
VPRGLARHVAGHLSQALRLDRGTHRRDPDLLPAAAQHHKHLKSANLLERVNEEIKRRTVRIFPNADSWLRSIRTLAVETHENWLEAHRYLNMDDLREHKKEACASRREPKHCPADNARALPAGATTVATMIQFAEDSGHNWPSRRSGETLVRTVRPAVGLAGPAESLKAKTCAHIYVGSWRTSSQIRSTSSGGRSRRGRVRPGSCRSPKIVST